MDWKTLLYIYKILVALIILTILFLIAVVSV